MVQPPSSIRKTVSVAVAAVLLTHPAPRTPAAAGRIGAHAFRQAPPPPLRASRWPARREERQGSPARVARRGRGRALSVGGLNNDGGDVDGDDRDRGDGGEDWRAFRARLVRDGLPSLDDGPAGGDAPRKDGRFAHVTTPLVEAGSVLLSVPTRDLCQALEQQYWHRSAVIITEVSDDAVNGEIEDAVPEEQLANGDGRGRWSYRGLLLNRCTNLSLRDDEGDDENATPVLTAERCERISCDDDATKDRRWRIRRGGDLLGLDSCSGTEFVCLHRPPTRDGVRAPSSSRRLVGDLSLMTLAEAQSLCREHPTKYCPSDFATFAGFCSWRPGQLEREMGEGRNEWIVLSVDGETVWEALRPQGMPVTREGPSLSASSSPSTRSDGKLLLEAGTEMWRNLLRTVDVSETSATERLTPGQLDFYDRMLEVWADDNLNVHPAPAASSPPPPAAVLDDSSERIGPGTLVRARSPPTSDALLYDAEFLKSLVLVLEDAPDATVGIILSHPMAAAVECREGGYPLPLRYGGPIDVPSWKDGSYRDDGEEGTSLDGGGKEEEEDGVLYEGFVDYQNSGVAFEDMAFDEDMMSEIFDADDDDDEDYATFIWIHRDAALGSQGPDDGGGARLGTSGLWLINEDDALEALQDGILELEDTMIFAGVCIWEKGPNLGTCGGGLREQVDALRSLEVVRAWNERSDCGDMGRAWDILAKRQGVLTKESLESNTNAAIRAWEMMCPGRESVGSTKTRDQNDEDILRSRLSDAALKAWLGVNLLEDPLGTLVEVRDDERRELFGQ